MLKLNTKGLAILPLDKYNLELCIFETINYPKTLKEAELIAKQKNYQTLLCINDEGNFCGGPNNIWTVGIPEDYIRINNFILYENKHHRKVIIWSKEFEKANRVYSNIIQMDNKVTINFSNIKYLCHSTPYENIESILESEYLLSYSELQNQGKCVLSQRGDLNEPKDYLENIDFCTPHSLSSEIVVASRQFKQINFDKSLKYKPGIRIYFPLSELLKLDNICIDGIHTFTVHKMLPIHLASHFVFPCNHYVEKIMLNKNISKSLKEKCISLNGFEYWYAKEFIEKANNLVI